MSQNNLEFKVVDGNEDFMGHLFGGSEPATPAATEPAAPTVVAPAVQATPPTQPQQQQQQAPVQQPQQPKVEPINPADLLTKDDLLASIGAIDTPSGDPAPATPPTQAAPDAPAQPAAPAAPKGQQQAPALPDGLTEDDVKVRNKLYTQHMINIGVWQPFEGVDIDEIDFSVENFQKIAEIQTDFNSQRQVGTKWDNIKKSDKMIETILDYIENDKDPSEILDLFAKQRNDTTGLDFESLDGNLAAIRKFYSEKTTPKWDAARVNRHIKMLELDGEEAIRAEGKYVQDQYGEVFEAERKAKVAATEAEAAAKAAQRDQSIRDNYALLQKQGFKPADAQKLLKDVYQGIYKQEGSTQLLTELDKRLLAIKNNPEAYMEYAQFVLDPVGFKKAIATASANATTNNIWNTLKTGEKKVQESAQVTSQKQPKNDNIYEQLLIKK